MKKLIAILLALAMVFAFAACGGSGDTATTGDTTAAADSSASTEKAADTGSAAKTENAAAGDAAPVEAAAKTLRIALDVEPTSLDPNLQADGYGSMFVAYSLFDTLFMYTGASNGEMVNHLVESYDYTETTLTLNLRQDAKFSDGSAVTAADIIWSINYANQGTGAMRLSNIDVANITSEGDYTVILPLFMQSPTLLEDLSQTRIMCAAWCDQGADNINLNPVASGAYKLESWETGMGIVLTKNENYYDAASVYYDTIEISFIGSEDTRLLSFENGDFDIAVLTSSSSIDEVNNTGCGTMFVGQIQSVAGIAMNTTDFDNCLQDQRVRQAIAYAIDVPTLVSVVCGSAYSTADSMIPSSNWAYVSTDDYAYNLDAAIALLNEAGYNENNKATFTMTISDAGFNSQMAEAIQGMLAATGCIDMAIETQDGATFMSNILGNTIEATLNTYMGSSDPAGVVNARRVGLPAHLSAFGDADLAQQLEDTCNNMGDMTTRAQLWADMQHAASEYCNVIPIYEQNVNYVVNGTVNVDSMNASMQADGYLFGAYIQGN